MSQENVIIRFENLSFSYDRAKPILDEADFSVRENAKITIMGQNGAGKSTIFKLITGELKPDKGAAHTGLNSTIAMTTQVMKSENFEKTIEKFFADVFPKKMYDLPKRVKDILEVLHLTAPLDKKIKDFSGGQQARLLLALALIQKPDILLLDEPTNNLDKAGIEHLITFLVMYEKTVIVISHNADFLNCFTEGVIYLDVFTKKLETYVGDYYSVVEKIKERDWNLILRYTFRDLGLLILLTLIGIGIWGLIL